LDFTTLVSPLGCLKSYVFVMPSHGPRLEPKLVGEQHLEILQGLLSRFVVNESTGRRRLRPGAGGLVVLTGQSGSGKSRIVRELYRALRDGQSQPGYWPTLGPDFEADVPLDRVGIDALSYRKVLGPPADFHWPPHSVPDFLWWSIDCQRTSSAYLDAVDLAADRLLQHREPAQFGWSRAAAGPEKWALGSARLAKQAARAVHEEGMSEATAALLAELAGQAVPFGGLALRGVRKALRETQSARERAERLAGDSTLGQATGSREDPSELVLGFIRVLVSADFPLIVAVEDVHDADRDTLTLLSSLGRPEFHDRVLIITTAWPEGLTRVVDAQPANVAMETWLETEGAMFARIDSLSEPAAGALVLAAFPNTSDEVVAAIARRWRFPLALGLVLDLLARRGRTSDGTITATPQDIARIPPDLQGLYNEQFKLLPPGAQLAVVMDVVCGMDATTFDSLDRPPGPDSSYVPVHTDIVSECASQTLPTLGTLDHQAALKLAWLSEAETSRSSSEAGVALWLTPREAGFAIAAWNELNRSGLDSTAINLRRLVTHELADRINSACIQNGREGLFIAGDRWWLPECAWMLQLVTAGINDDSVHAAATRSSIQLFRHRARLRPGEALEAFHSWIPEWEFLLGPDHPDTLTSRNNLASAHQDAGDLGRAIPLYTQTLTDSERILGPNHPDTLTSRNNLAYAYQAAGDLGRAIPLYTQTLTDSERILGPNHPDTLTSRNNLASAHQDAGDLGRAIPLYTQTLTDSERILGPNHPDTLTSRNNLASAYETAGDLGRAIPLYTQNPHRQ
jgi:tetratricopeptide (TPR) repeat protein/energy-coupling factor transporter ATP-binding protein EcfA2